MIPVTKPQRSSEQQPAMQVGHPVIDAQHEQIFEWLAQLEQACSQGPGGVFIGVSLGNLHAYVAEHFETEERLMRRIGYPYIDQHHQLHEELGEQVRRLSAEFQKAQPGLSVERIQLLRTWLVVHINQVDAELSQYIATAHENSTVDPWLGSLISLQV